ncbi:MAG: AAA family ATPase [bacterium]|nr:AAA family ATPase [bacterium]
MSTVKIKNVQAIRFIEFDMPDGQGGVRILKGGNGAGKTTAIACLNALLGRKVALGPTRGAPYGEIEGLGVSKKVQKKITSKGDPEVANLENRFDFSDLVDPPVKDPKARTKSRIRALVGLTAESASEEDFYDLVGGKERYEEIMGDRGLDGITDVLDMADEVKKAIQGHARLAEARKESAEAKWQTYVEESKGADPKKAPPSVASLADDFAKAKDARQSAERALERFEEATQHNAAIEAKIKEHGKSMPDEAKDMIVSSIEQLDEEIADLERKLAAAKQAQESWMKRHTEWQNWEERQTELEEMLINIDQKPAGNVAQLKAAEAKALEALENAEEEKSKHEAAVKAAGEGAKVLKYAEEAEQLREMAKGTDSVVTGLLPSSCPLQVQDGTLVYERNGEVVDYQELSEGERWEIALDVAIDAVGCGGVIPCSQEAWQALDTESKEAIAGQCKAAHVWLVTGEVDDGPLRVESF